jgi:hypothetical protein
MPDLHVVHGDHDPVTERFELRTPTGQSLGPVDLPRPAWPIGVIINRDNRPPLRVVRLIPPENATGAPILVVEPVTGSR